MQPTSNPNGVDGSAAQWNIKVHQPPKTVVRAVGLTKEYATPRSKTVAVRDVSISLKTNSFIALRGPSGAGKTTLLGLLGGLIAPTRGEVWINDTCLTHLREHHLSSVRRHLVGVVFQERGLIDTMSLWHNVTLPAVPLGGPDRDCRRRAEALLSRFGLAELAGEGVERLSGGERQRGALVRALLLRPPLLLLDEPTSHLDAEQVCRVLDLLIALRDEGLTVLAATHDERLAGDGRLDGVLELDDGVLCSTC